MAYPGKTIRNPKTGQSIKFIQTTTDSKGSLLEMISTFNANSVIPPLHYHPLQTEDFTILEGEISINIDGDTKIYREGEKVHIPKMTIHGMWNHSEDTCKVNWIVKPALKTEYFLENAFGYSTKNNLHKDWKMPFPQKLSFASKFHNEFRLVNPPFLMIRILGIIFHPFSQLFGFKRSYPEFIN